MRLICERCKDLVAQRDSIPVTRGMVRDAFMENGNGVRAAMPNDGEQIFICDNCYTRIFRGNVECLTR